MDVIGHDAPCQEAIAAGIEVKQGVLDQRCDLCLSEPTDADAGIKIAIDAMNTVFLVQDRSATALGKLSANRNVTN